MAEQSDGKEQNLLVNEAMLIQLMRNYDVLMAILTRTDRDTADSLLELHMQGRTVGPMPYLTLDEE